MVEDSSGRLMVGHSSSRDVANVAQPKIQIEGTSVSTSTLSVVRNSNDAAGPVLALSKTRGTSTGSSTVVQNGDTAGSIYFAGGDGTDVNSYAAWIEAEIDNTPGGNDMPGRLVFSTSANGAATPTERMRLDSGGRLGIGATPGNQEQLLVHGGDTSIYVPFARSDTRWLSIHSGGSDPGIFTNDGANLRFGHGSARNNFTSERMRIDSGGSQQNYRNSAGTVINSRTGQSGFSASTFRGYESASSTTTGTASFVVYANGNVQNKNNSYGQISDVKLKENIVDANSQWDDLKALQIRNWNFKEETGYATHTQIGVVAQEVEAVSPGLVYETPDRDDEGVDLGTVTKGVNYSVLYIKAVKALQEAQTRIETLETQHADLLARVAALEAA